MNKKQIKNFLFLVFTIIVINVKAQETTLSAGNQASGSSGTVDYSVGQVFYTSISSITGTINTGIQQPYEIFLVTDLKSNYDFKNISVDIFPNPTSESISIGIKSPLPETLTYCINDINGKALRTGEIIEINTNISLKEFPTSIYFVSIIQNNQIIKTYKIVKH